MDYSFDITLKTRMLFKSILESLSLEGLNKVPERYNNNIFWNIKHVLVTQQLLMYNQSGLPMTLSNNEIEAYKKGSKVEFNINQEDVEILKDQLFSTLEKAQEDYKKGIFKNFQEYTVTTKSVLSNIEDVIEFNNFHEGIHLGYVFALRKLI